MAKKSKTKEVKDYWARVIELGPHPLLRAHDGRRTIHHIHGGSAKEAGIHVGMSQRNSDWLVICLPESLHTGNQGIDYGYGVQSWERDFMPQMDILRWTMEMLGVNVFEKAGLSG